MDWKIGRLTFRELAGFTLMFLLLLAGIFSTWYMERQYVRISSMLEESVQMVLSGRWDEAGDLVEEARNDWEHGWDLRAVFESHAPMEEIDALFAEASVYAAVGEKTDFAQTCAVLSRQVEAMGNAQRISWRNVL